MERRELGRSGVSVTRIVLGCGNFGGVGLGACALRAGHLARGGAADHGRRLGARDHDVRHRGRLRRRAQRGLDRRVARDEGVRRQRRDHDRDEDVQSHGRGRRPRALAASDHAPDRDESRAPGRRARCALHGACARRRDARRGDDVCLRRARASGEGRRRRRVELHRGAARGVGGGLGARGAHALRVGAELVLAARPERRRHRVPGLSRARARFRGAQRDRREAGSRGATVAARATRRDRA